MVMAGKTFKVDNQKLLRWEMILDTPVMVKLHLIFLNTTGYVNTPAAITICKTMETIKLMCHTRRRHKTMFSQKIKEIGWSNVNKDVFEIEKGCK